MTRVPLLIAFLVLSLSSFAQSKSFDPGTFDRVAINYGIDAVLVKGDTHGVVVEAKQSVLDVIKVEVIKENLQVSFDQKAWDRIGKLAMQQGIKVTITTPTLSGVQANGGSDVESSETWESSNFNVMANGGADLTLILDVENLKATCNGGSDIYLSGTARNVKMMANGGSDIEAKNLMTTKADVTANGAGDISINVSKTLKARANGGSDIEYYGAASNIDVRANGGSDIDRG